MPGLSRSSCALDVSDDGSAATDDESWSGSGTVVGTSLVSGTTAAVVSLEGCKRLTAVSGNVIGGGWGLPTSVCGTGGVVFGRPPVGLGGGGGGRDTAGGPFFWATFGGAGCLLADELTIGVDGVTDPCGLGG